MVKTMALHNISKINEADEIVGNFMFLKFSNNKDFVTILIKFCITSVSFLCIFLLIYNI